MPIPKIIHHPAGHGSTIWLGNGIYTFKATTKETDGSLSAIEVSLPPGGGPEPHVHPDADETFLLHSGEIEILNGDNRFVVTDGAFAFVPRGTLHAVRNIGFHVARLTFIYTPGSNKDEYFNLIGTEARAGQEPSPLTEQQVQLMREHSDRYGIEFAS